MKSFIKPLALAFTAAVVTAATPGCAGSNASRATFDTNRSLSFDQLDQKAADLVADIVSNPDFARWKEDPDNLVDTSAGRKVVVRLLSYDDSGMPREWQSEQKTLFRFLSQHFQRNSVVFEVSKSSAESSGSNYIRGIEYIDDRDSDADYDQGTGKITTSRRAKGSLGMELSANMQKRAGDVDIVLFAVMVDLERKSELLNANSKTKNPGSESR
jgi:hypothetical protein